MTSDGFAMRFGLDGFREVSTKAGRRYARPADGAEVTLATVVTGGDETIIAASQGRRVLLCRADEINFLSGPGKGVTLIKLSDGDKLVAAIVADERPGHADGQDQHGRRAAAEHGPVQGHGSGRQRPRVRQPRADRRGRCHEPVAAPVGL